MPGHRTRVCSFSLAPGLRIQALFSISMFFGSVTTGPQVTHSGPDPVGPVSYRFGYGVLAAYRFVPTVAAEVEQIRAAHHVRGFAPGWGPRGLWRRLRAFSIPLLAASDPPRRSGGPGDGQPRLRRRRAHLLPGAALPRRGRPLPRRRSPAPSPWTSTSSTASACSERSIPSSNPS